VVQTCLSVFSSVLVNILKNEAIQSPPPRDVAAVEFRQPYVLHHMSAFFLAKQLSIGVPQFLTKIMRLKDVSLFSTVFLFT